MPSIAGAEPMFSAASPATTACSDGCWLGASILGEILHLVSGHCWFCLLLLLAAGARQVFDHTPQETICTALFHQDVSHLWSKKQGRVWRTFETVAF
jgi:hypothetical protein